MNTHGKLNTGKLNRPLSAMIDRCVEIVPELGPIFAEQRKIADDLAYIAPEFRPHHERDARLIAQGTIYGAMQAFLVCGKVSAETDARLQRVWSGQEWP